MKNMKSIKMKIDLKRLDESTVKKLKEHSFETKVRPCPISTRRHTTILTSASTTNRITGIESDHQKPAGKIIRRRPSTLIETDSRIYDEDKNFSYPKKVS